MAKHRSPQAFEPVGPNVAIFLWMATVLMGLSVATGIAIVI